MIRPFALVQLTDNYVNWALSNPDFPEIGKVYIAERRFFFLGTVPNLAPTCLLVTFSGLVINHFSLNEIEELTQSLDKCIDVGFPLNEKAAQSEKYAKLTIDGYEARFAMTGIGSIVNALKAGLSMDSLSTSFVKEAIVAFEELHKRMWALCDAEDAAKKQNNN